MTPQAISAPRARQSDPSTSHAAAKRAERFADSHAGKILQAIKFFDSWLGDGMNAADLSFATGLTVVQIDRRTIELQRKGLIRVKQLGGSDVVRNGMRVWEAT